jgi:transketolase
LRKLLVDITYETGGSYLAQALSAIDMMTALYFRYVKHDPKRPRWPERDRFLLSPGHYALPLYVILAKRGYFPIDLLGTFKQNGSPIELISHKDTVPGVEVSGGSLGQVLSLGVGMAIAAKMQNQNHRIFVFMSDGEQDEGQIWEAAASAAHFHLDNLIAVIDKNGFQVDGPTDAVMNMGSLVEKYRAFGWHTKEVDGNDMTAIVDCLDELVGTKGKPAIMIGNTIRGKGLSFMEGNPAFHYTRLDRTLKSQAIQELSGDSDAI